MVNSIKTRKQSLSSESGTLPTVTEDEESKGNGEYAAPLSPVPSAQVPPKLDVESSIISLEGDIVELHKKLSHLNRKLTLTAQNPDLICPGEIIQHLQRVERETERFKERKEVSVSKTIIVQNVYTETLALTFGANAAVLFKLVRFSIRSEFKGLSESQRDAKMIPATSPVFRELRATSALVWEVVRERNNSATWILNFRDGVRAIIDTTHHLIFCEMLLFMSNPQRSEMERPLLTHIVKQVRENLTKLFSSAAVGVGHLDQWLLAEKEEGFTKHMAVAKLRQFFPFSGEMHTRTYAFTGLEECDKAIEGGISDWEYLEETPPGYESEEDKMENSRRRMRAPSPEVGTSLDALYEQIKRQRHRCYDL
ncbi:unnamed protein product [Oikopleura dioica]|nr:unnamed protein product [Oikopleura dioica]